VDLAAARQLVPYLARLGVSHLYCSPVFTARRGSTHGYDVADPLRVDPALGGEAALARLVAALRRARLGLVLDIVPNHQVADPDNPYFADVLRHGRHSRYAPWFDVAWGRAGRIVLPVLGAAARDLARRGELAVAHRGREPVLVAHGRAFPLAPETHDAARALLARERPPPAALERLLDAQAYRLLPWQTGRRRLNYRRFFDIDELIAVRCEDPTVFAETHAALLDWVGRGWVDAVRVDHVDGLADPAGYLARLRAALDAQQPGVPIWVEKILGEGEALPRAWPVAGTTGYEFAAALDAASVVPGGTRQLRRSWTERTGAKTGFGPMARAAKREVLATLFPGELARVTAALRRALVEAGVPEPPRIRAALVEAIAALDVYRSYADPRGRLAAPDRARWRAALTGAARERPALAPTLRAMRSVLLGRRTGPEKAAFLSAVQQLSGPVAAKGVEDTALYRYHPVPSLCEVGGDPEAPHGDALGALHRENATRLRTTPETLLAATTHDTKRTADVRARLAALTAYDTEWCRAVERWMRRNARWRKRFAGEPAPEPAAELMLYQALLALWPSLPPGAVPTAATCRALATRITGTARKAAREAKRRTTWAAPDVRYEAALERFLVAILADRRGFLAEFAAVARPIVEAGAACALARRLVQLTAPGVPDLYRGDELGLLALVDPDNRRPVDFARARRRLAALERMGGRPRRERLAALARWAARPADERLVLWVTRAALALRGRWPGLFAGGAYRPLALDGPASDHWLAFVRTGAGRQLLVAARIRPEREAAPARLRLPASSVGAPLSCALTGRRLVPASRRIPVETLTGPLPLALFTASAPEAQRTDRFTQSPPAPLAP
jgi:malto-oligosyltrehalose synthase